MLDTITREIEDILRDLQSTIADDYRAHEEAEGPSMSVTFATNNGITLAYQTGDNSYTGPCYHYPYWGVVDLYRDDTLENIRCTAEYAANELFDQLHEDGEYPDIETAFDYARYQEAVDATLADYLHTSPGDCPGCDECDLPHVPDNPNVPLDAPLVTSRSTLVAVASQYGTPIHHTTDSNYLTTLWIYSEEFGPHTVVHSSDSIGDAWDALLDSLPPIPHDEVPEAYGFETRNGRTFDPNGTDIGPDTLTPSEVFDRVSFEDLELIEGYEYQPNAGDSSGIVQISHHHAFHELTREHVRALGLQLTIENEGFDPYFSHSPCEICDRPFGGNRYPVHAVDANGEIVHFNACDDCYYYVEYGRLDDETMDRVA